MKRSDQGITLIELLIVIAILGIVMGIGVINGRRIGQQQSARGAVATFQQSVWQGATAAASRGITVELVRTADGLALVNVANDKVLRAYDVPSSVVINADNPILRFLPPGKVDFSTLEALPDDLIVDTGEGRYRLEISLIGEVESSQVGDG